MKIGKSVLAGRILTGLLCLQFGFSAVCKLFPEKLVPQMATQMAAMGLNESLLPILAALEILCIVTFVVPATSVMGAVLFTGYLGGAILTHLRVGENVVMQVVLGILVWLAMYLREPRLRSLLPLRKCCS